MHVTTTSFIVTWVSLIILIKDSNSGLVSRGRKNVFGEVSVFSSAEDGNTNDVSVENDNLQNTPKHLYISWTGKLYEGIKQLAGNLRHNFNEVFQDFYTQNKEEYHNNANYGVTGRSSPLLRRIFKFGLNNNETMDVSRAQEEILNAHYRQIVADLGETFRSRWENNFGHDLFGDKSEVTSADTEFNVASFAVSRESLQDTEDVSLQWLGSESKNLSPEQDDSRVKNGDRSITNDYRYDGNDWYSGRDLIKEMFDQNWFSSNPGMSAENTTDEENLKFACVDNKLWGKFYAIGSIQYKGCEFTCDCEEVPEEKSRWKRFIIRIPECGKGSRRIRRRCRLAWG
jgi:hypothetical protein